MPGYYTRTSSKAHPFGVESTSGYSLRDAPSTISASENMADTIQSPEVGSFKDIQRTHVSSRPSSGRRSDQQDPPMGARIFPIIGALGSSTLELWLGSQTSENGSPFLSVIPGVCERVSPSTKTPLGLPHAPSRSYQCEITFVTFVVLTTIFWVSTVSLFSRGRWREKYYRWVFVAVALGVPLASLLVEDVAVLVVLIIPVILDVCIIASGLVDVFQRFSRH